MQSKLLIILALAFSSSVAFAQSKTDIELQTKSLEKKCTEQQCSEEDINKIVENKSTLNSLTDQFKFGIAIGFENYGSNYVTDAETLGDDRIVRINNSQEYKPSVWLETHYIWDGWASRKGFTHSAPGFYVGARLLGPESDVFEAFSLGLMWSFKRTAIGHVPPAGQIAESINIGFGPVWHKTKALATGIVEGEALPDHFNDIKYDNRDEVSWMLMISAGF